MHNSFVILVTRHAQISGGLSRVVALTEKMLPGSSGAAVGDDKQLRQDAALSSFERFLVGVNLQN